jgi:beta-glucanase (GH16 family)
MKLAPLVLAGVVAAQAMAAEWNLIWSDEFEGSGLPDTRRWTNEVGFIRNAEAQYYTAGRLENARLENGRLVIEAHKERFKNERVSGRRQASEFAEYTSASLTTQKLGEWLYGRIEVRAKLPQGRGVWPAIWMLGSNIRTVGWPRCGEIDIMEFVGYDPDFIHANIHTGRYNHTRGSGKGNKIKVSGPWEGFHVYTVEWAPERLDFFLDDEKFFTFEKEAGATVETWPFDQPFYLILNLAIGGAWGGQKGIDDSIFPQRFEIDYVRVFEKKSD